jgi:hypothetical protein
MGSYSCILFHQAVSATAPEALRLAVLILLEEAPQWGD